MSALAEIPADRATIDGLCVSTSGRSDAPPILFSSGLGGSGSYWKPQVADFARDHFVITYDHRGTGHSARAPLPAGYAVDHLADDIATILDGLNLARAHVVGHAAGAAAGLALAGKVSDRMLSLAMVNGWVRPGPHFRRCMSIRRDLYRAGGAWAYLRAQPLFLYPPGWIDENLDHLDAEMEIQVTDFQSAEALFARMQALETTDFTAMLPSVRTPVLVLAADDDSLVPPSGSVQLAAGLPHACLLRLPIGGHAVNVTAPAEFNDALRTFLKTKSR